MASSYSLRINTSDIQIDTITEIIGCLPTSSEFGWEFEIEDRSEYYHLAIDFLLNLIDGKMDLLNDIGIEKEEVYIWFLYEYEDQQCNIEFKSEDLKRMGDLGVGLCISCWEKNSSISF